MQPLPAWLALSRHENANGGLPAVCDLSALPDIREVGGQNSANSSGGRNQCGGLKFIGASCMTNVIITKK